MFLYLSLVILAADPQPAMAPHYAAELIVPLHDAHNHAPGIVECASGDLFAT